MQQMPQHKFKDFLKMREQLMGRLCAWDSMLDYSCISRIRTQTQKNQNATNATNATAKIQRFSEKCVDN